MTIFVPLKPGISGLWARWAWQVFGSRGSPAISKCLLSPAELRALGRGKQSRSPKCGPWGQNRCPRAPSHRPGRSAPLASLHPAAAQPSPGESPGVGGVHGNGRLSWLLFASANLQNALVFPFGLGGPQQLPFMPTDGGRGSQRTAIPGLFSPWLHSSPSDSFCHPLPPSQLLLELPQKLEINVLNFGHFNPFSFL